MPKPVLILITGLPGTGKTTLSKAVADHIKIPLIAKDSLKEILFDQLGWSSREWSIKLGSATYHLLHYIIEQQLKAGHSLMVESPLSPEYENNLFQGWQKAHGFFAIQVLCYANSDVLIERFEKRAATAERHPGHVEKGSTLVEMRRNLAKGKDEPLDLEGEIIEVDTTDFKKLDAQLIIERIRGAVRPPYLL